MDTYQVAQRALADLKAAVLAELRASHTPLTNAELGRKLGIYMGHVGHEGHLSRTVLSLLEAEGLATQAPDRGPWTAVN